MQNMVKGMKWILLMGEFKEAMGDDHDSPITFLIHEKRLKLF